ncbi:MAG: IPT/TIG domain-containing protein, partial [Myxococcota bacterium]|nr:IPT/TIG domain-containing protein [Myxococcota bacterium]
MLTGLEPSEGLISAGQQVTVTGEHFDASTRIMIGGRQLIEPVLLDSTAITGRVPSRLKGWHGAVDVVASDGFEQRTLTRGFRYHDTVEVSWLSPSSGSTAGATYLTLYGTGLTSETVVRFGGVVAEVVHVGRGDVMIVRTPPGHQGPVDLFLSDPRQSRTLSRAFTYVDPDLLEGSEILNGWPHTADTEGGTQVALTVTGLPANASTLNVEATVNDVEATVLEVRPSEHLVVLSVPVGEVGPAEIVLTTGAGVVSTDTMLVYQPALFVESFSPGVVPPQDTTAVVFQGRGFDAETRLVVEGVIITPDAFTETRLDVHLPPSSPGRADILIISEEDELRIPAGVACRTNDDATVLAVSTPDGARSGGRVGRLFGDGFSSLSGPPEVLIDELPVEDVEIVDDAEIRFRTPPGINGAVSVDARELGFIAMGYERFDPTVGYGGTSGGDLPEALNITVLDLFTNQPIELAFVTLWDDASTPFQGLTDSRGQITFSAPGMETPQMATASKDQYT